MSCLFQKKPEIILFNSEYEFKGCITTYGNLAATISFDGHEWYAPFKEISDEVMEMINKKYTNINVSFKVDKSKTYGKTLKGNRFYAKEVKEIPIKFLENKSRNVNSIII